MSGLTKVPINTYVNHSEKTGNNRRQKIYIIVKVFRKQGKNI